jgi:hypothetical protein
VPFAAGHSRDPEGRAEERVEVGVESDNGMTVVEVVCVWMRPFGAYEYRAWARV